MCLSTSESYDLNNPGIRRAESEGAVQSPAEESRKRALSTREVIRLCGCTARQIQWWTENQIIACEIRHHDRVFQPEDAVLACVVRFLRLKRVSLPDVRAMRKALQKAITQDLEWAVCELLTRKVWTGANVQEAIERAVRSSAPVVLVPVGMFWGNVDKVVGRAA